MKSYSITSYDRIIYAFCITFICSALFACTEDKTTAEEEIKQYIESAKQAAENRQHGDLADLIDDSYADHKDLHKKQLVNMLRGYFFSHQNIHLFTRIESIELQSESSAFITLYVAMSGKVIADVNALSRMRARIYRLELALIKDDHWLLQQAKWKTASLAELL